jgi:hypothetical protein
MTISKGLLDELLKGCERPEDLLGDAGLMKELKIKLMERMLGAELTAHLGYEGGECAAGPAEPAQRLFLEDAEEPGRRVADRRAARPEWQLRARTGQEGPGAYRRDG